MPSSKLTKSIKALNSMSIDLIKDDVLKHTVKFLKDLTMYYSKG